MATLVGASWRRGPGFLRWFLPDDRCLRALWHFSPSSDFVSSFLPSPSFSLANTPKSPEYSFALDSRADGSRYHTPAKAMGRRALASGKIGRSYADVQAGMHSPTAGYQFCLGPKYSKHAWNSVELPIYHHPMYLEHPTSQHSRHSGRTARLPSTDVVEYPGRNRQDQVDGCDHHGSRVSRRQSSS